MRKVRFKLCYCLFTLLFVVSRVDANETIRSSVSPEFRDGLQEKYLRYLAKKMDMDLKIYPMPFARRIRAIKKGEIDIMVGVKGVQPVSGNYDKLQPSYEQVQSLYFVRSEDADILVKREDLKKLVAGLTIDEQTTLKNSEKKYLNIVTVTTLHQKIELLLLGRIDTFLHFGQSAHYVLKQKGLADTVITAKLKDGIKNDYYIIISTQSPLYPYKDKFESAIRQSIEANDFKRIRQQHYEALLTK